MRGPNVFLFVNIQGDFPKYKANAGVGAKA